MLGQIGEIEKKRGENRAIEIHRAFSSALLLIALVVFFGLLAACQKPRKIDLRSVAPKDALVYLETNDLAAALDAVTANRAFQTLARTAPDFSDLKNVQTAIVVNGFGSSDEINADEAVLNFKPHFVAIAETNLWNWQAVSVVENQINDFVSEKLGASARLEKSDKYDGKFYAWTAADNRRIFALLQGGLIYFGNDEAIIERCAAARKGAIESLISEEFPPRDSSPDELAFGYVSPAGTQELADLAGVFAAAPAAENGDEKNFIAQIVPQILRGTIDRIFWTAKKTDAGIEDEYRIFLKPPTAQTIRDSFTAENKSEENLTEFLPADFFSATRYRAEKPLGAWQNSLFLVAGNSDPLRGKLLVGFSDSLLEPYGIADAKKFLSEINSEIIVARLDENGDRSIVIAQVKNIADLKKSLTSEINFAAPPEKMFGTEIWFSEDKTSAAAFAENVLILGDAASVQKCLQVKQNPENKLKNQRFEQFVNSNALVATFGKDTDSADRIARLLTEKKSEKMNLATFYLTETNFSEAKIERRNVSDFGLIGMILKQLEQ